MDIMNKIPNTLEAKAMRVLHYISSFFSALLSPLMMPTYGMNVSLWMSNLLVLTHPAKLTVLSVIFLLTCVVPVALILLLKALKLIEDPHLNNRKERFIPYVITIVCYVASALYLASINAPEWLWMFMFGGGCAALVSMIVNFAWKISAHMAGIGGFVALVCRINADGDGIFELLPVICIAIVIAGILGTSRIAMERHTFWQVIAGTVNGFVCVYFL